MSTYVYDKRHYNPNSSGKIISLNLRDSFNTQDFLPREDLTWLVLSAATSERGYYFEKLNRMLYMLFTRTFRLMTERVQGSSAGLPHSPPASLSGKTATKLPPLTVWRKNRH